MSDSARAGLLERRGHAVDAWLSEQLQALGTLSTDQTLSQVQQITAEADRRGRPALAAEPNGSRPACPSDAMLGVALNENFTVAAHLRYVAQTDL